MTAKHTDTSSDKRKQSLYFPADLLAELVAEATRLDRSLSWCVQNCVRRGMGGLKKMAAQELPSE